MIVKQVINFTTIYFIHRNSDGKVSLVVLPVIDAALEQILNGEVLQTLHCESLS